MVQSNEQLAEMLKSNKEWSRAIVFDHTAKVIASTFEADPAEIEYVFMFSLTKARS